MSKPNVSQQRIIELQRQVRIAKTALEKLTQSTTSVHEAHYIAEEALEAMRPMDKTVPLAGLLNWERRPR